MAKNEKPTQTGLDLKDPATRARLLEREKDVIRLRDEARRAVRMEQRGATVPPEILTLRERLSRPRKPTPWRIVDLQAIGHRVILAAQFKAGKTTMVSNVVRSLLDDTPFLDTYDVSPVAGTVAVLDFEMADNQLDDWYRDQEIKNDDRLWVIPMRGRVAGFDIIDDEVRARWARDLRGRSVTYLIVDCLRPILDALGLNEHTETGRFLVALDALFLEAGISEGLIVHHMGHEGERSRGDSRLRDWPDVEWTLVRESDDPASARFLKAYGRGVDVPETQLTYNEQTRRLAVEGGTRKDAKALAALTDVVAYVAGASQPPSGRDIERHLTNVTEHGQKTIRAAIKLGVQSEQLTRSAGPNGGHLYSVATTRSATPPPTKQKPINWDLIMPGRDSLKGSAPGM